MWNSWAICYSNVVSVVIEWGWPDFWSVCYCNTFRRGNIILPSARDQVWSRDNIFQAVRSPCLSPTPVAPDDTTLKPRSALACVRQQPVYCRELGVVFTLCDTPMCVGWWRGATRVPGCSVTQCQNKHCSALLSVFEALMAKTLLLMINCSCALVETKYWKLVSGWKFIIPQLDVNIPWSMTVDVISI